MATDWLKPRPLPDDLAHVRDRIGVAMRLRVAVVAFVVVFAAGTAVPDWEAPSFLIGAAVALAAIVLYVAAMRGLDAERGRRELADWLLYRPEPGTGAFQLGLFALLGLGLAAIVVAALVRIVVG